MRAFTFALALTSAALMNGASTAALAASDAQTCSRGGESRTIEVVAPGKVGKACDLNVIRDNGQWRSTPYHADNSDAFCATRAADIVAGLKREGFSCGPVAQVEEAAPEPIAAAEPPAETAPVAPEPVASADAPASTDTPMEALIARSTAEPAAAPQAAEAPVANAPASETVAASTIAAPVQQPAAAPVVAATPAAPPSSSLAATSSVTAPPPDASTRTIASSSTLAAPPAIAAPAAQVGSIHAQPLEQPPLAPAAPEAAEAAPQKFASTGPVALSPTNASALKGVRAPRPAAGRFVGAAADAKPLDAALEPDLDPEAAEERLAQPSVAPVAPTAPAAKATVASAPTAPVKAAAPAPKARAAEDIIKSVLAAQTAAWNEGDLDAFMNVYWKDPELKFVSGSTVFRGWKETQKRYRDRYGAAGQMGRLTLDGLDVDLVSDDVATVVGRYRVDAAGAADVGLFTLVMKRFDGLWRIVHDHSTSETPNTH